MNIILVSPECYPFIKESSTADLVCLISKGIEKFGHNVKVFTPRYGSIDLQALHIERIPSDFRVSFDCKGKEKTVNASVHKGIIPDSLVGVFFIESQTYFSNSREVYVEQDEERFKFFSKAVLNIAGALDIQANIINLFDPYNLEVARLLRSNKIDYVHFGNSKIVFTVSDLRPDLTDNLMYLDYCDAVTTTSEEFAKELFVGKRSYLRNIVAGIDEEVYNPETDNNIAHKFSKDYFSAGKRKCKEDLLETLVFNNDAHLPLFAVLQSTMHEEEVNLLIDTLPNLVHMSLKLVILASSGSAKTQEVSKLASKCKNIKVCYGYNHQTVIKLLAGSDFFVSLRKSEPDGVQVQVAMKYGAVPVVYESGALKKIINANEHDEDTNGISFKMYTKEDLLSAVNKALRLYKDKTRWPGLVKSVMKLNIGSQNTIKGYLDLYESLSVTAKNPVCRT